MNVQTALLTLHGAKLPSPIIGPHRGPVSFMAVRLMASMTLVPTCLILMFVPVANGIDIRYLPDGLSPLSEVAPRTEPGTITLPLPCLCMTARC